MAFPGQTLAQLEALMLTTASQLQTLTNQRRAIAEEIRERRMAMVVSAKLASLSQDERDALRLALKELT